MAFSRRLVPSVTRFYFIPDNVVILFPILDSGCSFIEYPYLKTEKELEKCARLIQDHINFLNASLDGQEIPNLED